MLKPFVSLRPINALFLFATAAVAQAQYQGPGSVEYDPVGDRYFVSNTGSSLIRQQDQAGTVGRAGR
jgi:hypothetical protein